MTAPDWLRHLDEPRLAAWRHGWSTTKGPDFSSPPEHAHQVHAVQRLATAVGLNAAAWTHQVHGGAVLHAIQPGCQGEADALWTERRGLGVVGRSADCPLILVAGKRRDGVPLWGCAHASWRSTLAGVTARLLTAMTQAGLEAANATALVGPSAGPCCYEVGDEVRDAALAALGAEATAFLRPRGARWHLDLWQANAAQLRAAGLPAAGIVFAGVCTICRGLEYPSHRRQRGRAGRFAAIIGAPGAAGSA